MNRHNLLQRKKAGESERDMVPSIVHEALRSSGKPLDDATRAFMEPRFGHDFSQVRVHIDNVAAQSAEAVQARAYTVGTHLVFGEGEYQPETLSGLHLLAHELTHVIQQSYETVSGVPIGGGLLISEPHDPFERVAQDTANSLMSPKGIELSGGSVNSLGEEGKAAFLNTPSSTAYIQKCGSQDCRYSANNTDELMTSTLASGELASSTYSAQLLRLQRDPEFATGNVVTTLPVTEIVGDPNGTIELDPVVITADACPEEKAAMESRATDLAKAESDVDAAHQKAIATGAISIASIGLGLLLSPFTAGASGAAAILGGGGATMYALIDLANANRKFGITIEAHEKAKAEYEECKVAFAP